MRFALLLAAVPLASVAPVRAPAPVAGVPVALDGRTRPSQEAAGTGTAAKEQDARPSAPLDAQRALLEEVRAALARGDGAQARAGVEALLAELVDEPAASTAEGWLDLLEQAGAVAFEAEDPTGARRAFERLLEGRLVLLGEAHPATLRARQNLGSAHFQLGALEAAREQFTEVVARLSVERAPEDSALLAARRNLAAVLSRSGDLVAARAIEEELVGILQRTVSEDDPGLLQARENLAVTAYLLGDRKLAHGLFTTIFATRERLLPAGHPLLRRARMNLAVTAKALGDLAGARAVEESILAELEGALPQDHPELQRARQNLAGSLLGLGELERAQELFAAVLAVYERTLPEDHTDVLDARQNLAAARRARGDLEGALDLERQALSAWEALLPGEHPHVVDAKNSLALTLEKIGDLEGARALQQQVLAARESVLGPDDVQTQLARLNLAATLNALGESGAALELQDLAQAALARVLPDFHPDVLRARSERASSLHDLGEFRAALALQEQILEQAERGLPGGHPTIGIARHNLATVLLELGLVERARWLFEQVCVELAAQLPEEHPHVQGARLNLALALKKAGDLPAARALEENALAVLESRLDARHPRLHSARNNLAATLLALGDVRGARARFEQALESLPPHLPADHPRFRTARLNLAFCLGALGHREQAMALEEQVLEACQATLPEDHPELQAARLNLALSLKAVGEVPRARELEAQALAARLRSLPAEHRDVQAARNNLAVSNKWLGEFDAARTLAEEALEVLERTLPGGDPDIQGTRQNLAGILAAAHACGAHLPNPERAAARERSRRDCAALLLAICRSQAQAVRDSVWTVPRREAEERAATIAERLGPVLSFALGTADLGGIPELIPAAFELSESTRGVALISAGLGAAVETWDELGELRDALAEASLELAGQARSGAGSPAYQAALRRRDAAERELLAGVLARTGEPVASRALDEQELARRLGPSRVAVAYRRFVRSTIAPAESSATPGRVVPLELTSDALCAFVLRGGEGVGEDALTLVDLGPLEPIEGAVLAWREALGVGPGRGLGVEHGAVSEEVERLGEILRERIFDPLLVAIGAARHLVLLPDDVLHLVPLDVLVAGRDSDAPGGGRAALGEVYRFEVRGTLVELLHDVGPVRPGALVALGGAAFDRDPLGPGSEGLELALASPIAASAPGLLRGGAFERGFDPLAFTGPEVRELADLFGRALPSEPVHLLEGRWASRESLESLASQARWLHVATHGWYASESMRSWSETLPLDRHTGLGLRSSGEEQVRGSSPMLLAGLALAGANLPENAIGRAPGLMTAEELSTLDLTGCELAVLSACDTNVGQRRAGQGVASLQRALQMAGARSVITSLWKVPDEATSELMLDFYRRLWVEDKPKHQALWEAKLRLRDAKDERGQPLYTLRDWAAWVLTGEPD